MSELPQLRDAIEAATQTLRALSGLESQMLHVLCEIIEARLENQ